MKKFEDVSIFQNIVEFFTGSEMIRAEKTGGGVYLISVEKEGNYIFDRAIKCESNKPERIYDTYIQS